MSRSAAVALCASLIFAAHCAEAQAPAGTQNGAPRCDRNPTVTVISREKTDAVGTTFLLRASTDDAKADCNPKPRPGDRTLGTSDDDAFYYIALVKSLLLLDAGTGPDRDLVIYQATTGRPLLHVGYWTANGCNPSDGCKTSQFSIGATGLTFWRTIKLEPTAKNCPNYETYMKTTGSAKIVEKSVFSFESHQVTGSRDRQCVPQQ